MREIYQYKSIPVPGGGFVTGFVFHPKKKDILYCRTDIGGCYRFDFNAHQWISLIDHATDPSKWETYPLAIAIDPNRPEYVYTMVGDTPIHRVGCSKDYGRTWEYFETPVIDDLGNTTWIHGNAAGRSTGERLIVDPFNSNILYMGTMGDGLWKTEDGCRTWKKIHVAYPGKMDEVNISFIEIDPTSKDNDGNANRLVVATSGQMGSIEKDVRGQSVYISLDGGRSFSPLRGEPKPILTGSKDYPGYVGQRAVWSGPYLFITYAAYNIGWSSWDSYGCDTGLCFDGAVIRYAFDMTGAVCEVKDVTPENKQVQIMDSEDPRRIGYGMSGIAQDVQNPGVLICSSICSNRDTIYRSDDYGMTWVPIMSGLDIGRIDFNVSYHKPEYNGNDSLIHWMSDLKINPFDSNMALFNTGTGVFMTENLQSADLDAPVIWSDCSDGMEETVHLNIYSPPAGDVKLIDIIGDYGGFAFKDLDHQAENTFANEQGDRWITAMNADFSDYDPRYLVVAPRGNWKGKTKGGIILSKDQGDHFVQLNNPYGLSEHIDSLLDYLKTPNVTAGWVALSSDTKSIVWGIGLPIYTSTLVYTWDEGAHWGKSKIIKRTGEDITYEQLPFKVFSDRVNPETFYGFGDHRHGEGFFVSNDRGATFHQIEAPSGFPKTNLAGIDSEQAYEIRVESEREGVIWMAMNEHGLWKIRFDGERSCFVGCKMTDETMTTKRIGLGKALEGTTVKTLFTSGTIQGAYGFYRSHDEGSTWIRINDDTTQFGDIRSISGDPRVFGRIYVATGTRGVVYGDIKV